MVADWTGADCSLRTCPSYTADAAAPDSNNNHNTVKECSGRGQCDRKTGEGNCNGRGKVMSLEALAQLYSCNNPAFAGQFNKKCFKGELYIGARYQNAWDANRQYGCLCDQGYAGPSCENILRPSGADVLGGEGAESGRECSGRGSCDYKAGVCVCHAGYRGQACQTQSTYN